MGFLMQSVLLTVAIVVNIKTPTDYTANRFKSTMTILKSHLIIRASTSKPCKFIRIKLYLNKLIVPYFQHFIMFHAIQFKMLNQFLLQRLDIYNRNAK